MKPNNLQKGIKSISLCSLDKNQNFLKTKLKVQKQKSLKCSLSKKKSLTKVASNTSEKSNLKGKIDKKKSKIAISRSNSKNNTINLKSNYSISKMSSIKRKEDNQVPIDENKIFTINIKLETSTQNFMKNNNNMKKGQNNKISISKNIKKSNPISIKENREKLIDLSATPKKKNINKINFISKPIKKNLFFLNISQNKKKEMKENNTNKISKSVIEKKKHYPNFQKNINNSYNKGMNSSNFMDSSKKTIMTKNSNSNIYKNNIENKNDNKKILVIDLDETLIHTSFQKINNPDLKIELDSNTNNKKNITENNNNTNTNNDASISISKKIEAYIRIRPGVDKFLSQMSKYYDIYVYSASSKNYLNTIIKNIDKNNIIKQCYCRDDCIMYVEDYEIDFDKPNNKYNYIKDLKKINKELRNIVFIDNNAISFKLQEKNGIPIKSWFDDYEDIELYKLIPILKNLSGFYDVREEISKFVKNKTFIWSKSINWLVENCLNSSYLNEINSVLFKEQQKPILHFGNFNEDINRPKVINNINNILINLNDHSNNFNKSTKYIGDKANSFFKRINTEFDGFNKNYKTKYKNIKVHKNNSEVHTDKKILVIDKNNSKLKDISNINSSKKRYFNSNASQKIQKNLFKKKIGKSSHLKKNSLVHQYNICFSKINLIEKMNLTQTKSNNTKSKINESKNINKYFLQNQNRVLINYINNDETKNN